MQMLIQQCTNLEAKAEDNAMIFLKFKRGLIAETVVSFTVVTPPTNSLEIYGTKGTILENHSWENPIKINTFHKDVGTSRGIWYEPRLIHGSYPKYYDISARLEDEYFADCILNDNDPEFTPEQARSAIATVLLGYLSAELGRTATLDELIEIARTKGTRGILEGLGRVIQNNYMK